MTAAAIAGELAAIPNSSAHPARTIKNTSIGSVKLRNASPTVGLLDLAHKPDE